MQDMEHIFDITMFNQIQSFNDFNVNVEMPEGYVDAEYWYVYDAEQEAADKIDIIMPEVAVSNDHLYATNEKSITKDDEIVDPYSELVPVLTEHMKKDSSANKTWENNFKSVHNEILSEFEESSREEDEDLFMSEFDSLLEWSEAIESPIKHVKENIAEDEEKSSEKDVNLDNYEEFVENFQCDDIPEPHNNEVMEELANNVFKHKSVNRIKQNQLKSQGPQKCRICYTELHTKNPYRALQDHYARFHFSDNLKILPTEKPYVCPVPDCKDKPYRDWQALMRHYMGQKHGILKKYLQGM